MKIIHLSDLHISDSWFVPKWGDMVATFVESAKPDLTVVTGDLTVEGRVVEYEMAHAYLGRLKTPTLLVVPGNHDARSGGRTRFEDMFGTRYPVYEDDSVVVCGIDSSQPDIDDGHVGRANYARIKDAVSVDGKARILAMHHHLIPTPGTGQARSTLTDAGDVLRLCAETEMDIVLAGHKHLPCVWNLDGTLHDTAGTACSRRIRGRSFPSFSIVTIEDTTVCVQLVDVSGGWGTQTITTTALRPAAARRKVPRMARPLAFESEPLGQLEPEDNWRHALGALDI